MKLPSMREATILTAQNCTEKIISSITVFDSSDRGKIEENSNDTMKSYDSELAITSFANCYDDIEQQYELIKTLKSFGETGIIVFYVGYILPAIDRRLIDLANDLDFVIIMMPEGRRELRYSDVIQEVMELIISRRKKEVHFANDMIHKISQLPKNKQNINSVVDILRDKIQCSIFIVDEYFNIINGAEWPVDRRLPVKDIIAAYNSCNNSAEEIVGLDVGSTKCYFTKEKIQSSFDENMYVVIIKESEGLSLEIRQQACEVLSTFINLWTDEYAKVDYNQLIKSILKNEPYKTQRICQVLNLDIASFDTMVIITNDNHSKNTQEVHDSIVVLDELNAKYISGRYNDEYIVFMKYSTDALNAMTENSSNIFTVFTNLYLKYDTAEVKAKHEVFLEHIEDVRKIHVTKKCFSYNEIIVTKECCDIINVGENEINKALSPIKRLIEKKNTELINTLSVFVLDCDHSVSKTSNRLFLHKNTVKYRLKQIEEILHIRLDKILDICLIYNSLIILRLLESKYHSK